MHYLAITMFVLWVVITVIHLYGSWLAFQHFGTPKEELTTYPPVSILKPMKGVENDVRANLETFFQLDYPEYEIIFSVADPTDIARPLIESLMRKYPEVKAQLIIGDIEVGTNPKVNNMIRSYHSAAHDLLLISDASVRADRDFLKRIVSELGPKTGIVTAAGTGRSPHGFGGHLEVTFLNTFYARWMIFATTFGTPTVVGHTMLFQRSTADRFGGIRNLARYLAEDHMSGQAMRQLGLKTKIMTEPVLRTIGKQRFKGFWDRHVRWGRMRKVHEPLAFAVEPLAYTFPTGLIGAFAAHALFGISGWAFFAMHLVIWFIGDLVIMGRIKSELHFATPVWWLLREALAVPMWAHTLSSNSVIWRGTPLELEAGGTVKTVASA